jgi:uncharacterized FlaG/YvyC family protein
VKFAPSLPEFIPAPGFEIMKTKVRMHYAKLSAGLFFCHGLAEEIWVQKPITRRYKMSVASVGYNPVSPMPIPTVRHDTATQQETNVKPQVIIRSATADLERIGSAFNKRLRFEVDHNSNEVIVKVIDKNTDKVIRELPPEELQRLHRNLTEAIGLLFDEMA